MEGHGYGVRLIAAIARRRRLLKNAVAPVADVAQML